jgi:hypothetical protein
VAIPYAAKVLDPVVPVPAKYMVSVVIAIVVVVALGPPMNAIVVPIGYGTLPLAGIVIV